MSKTIFLEQFIACYDKNTWFVALKNTLERVKASWATLISNINAHNAYRYGQILLLRKLQGSWDGSKGVG